MGPVRRIGVVLVLGLGWAMVPGAPGLVAAQETAPPALLLILDASGSMNGDDGTGRPKLAAAKDALGAVVAGLPDGAAVGLRVYGHRVPNNDKANGCQDTELVVPVVPLDRARLTAAISGFSAKGFTPIGASLRAAAGDLPPTGERTVVLVSDGIDTCTPPDPCQVARDLAGQGVGLRIETVGFQVDAQAADQLRCIAAATGGTYLDAPDFRSLTKGLTEVSARAFRNYVPTGEAVRGAADQGSAPLVVAGAHYQDSIRDGEAKWYAFDLGPRQRVTARAALIGPPAPAGDFAGGRWQVRLVDPRGTVDGSAQWPSAGFGLNQAAASGGTESALGPSEFPPGRWAVRLSLEGAPERVVGRDLPVELTIEIEGAGEERPPTAAPPDTESATASPAAASAAGGWSTASVVALCVVLAAVGAVVGASAVARLRR